MSSNRGRFTGIVCISALEVEIERRWTFALLLLLLHLKLLR